MRSAANQYDSVIDRSTNFRDEFGQWPSSIEPQGRAMRQAMPGALLNRSHNVNATAFTVVV
jgi:hypothetical protein